MKKLLGLIVLIFMISGCSSKEYDQLMQFGMDALEDEKYEEALTMFEKAAAAKNTDDVKQALEYTSYMTDGLEFFKKGKFSAAVESAEKITQAKEAAPTIKVLKPKALKLKEEALSLDESVQHAQEELARGERLLEEKKFDDAHTVLQAVSEIEPSHPKLKEIAKEASTLMVKATKQKKIFLAQQEEAEEAAKAQLREEVFQFLKGASAKQRNYDKVFSSKEEVIDYFSSHFTREYSRYFVEEMYMEYEGEWHVIATDFLIGYVPDFSYNEKTKVEVNGNTVTVSEWVPANDEGPVTWDAHTESVTLQKNGNKMIITDVNG